MACRASRGLRSLPRCCRCARGPGAGVARVRAVRCAAGSGVLRVWGGAAPCCTGARVRVDAGARTHANHFDYTSTLPPTYPPTLPTRLTPPLLHPPPYHPP
eukprot:2380155-Prymnesium_polylepis.1